MSLTNDKKNEFGNVLCEERMYLMAFMASMQEPKSPLGICRTKNVKDSTRYRQKGNEVYNNHVHNRRKHEQAWKLYSQSIALAPNQSEELALGYGNRSAILFHLEKYDDCIKDCDRAIEITTSMFLKTKLLCRKAECLALLDKNSARSTCEEALKYFSELPLNHNLKSVFTDKLQNILNSIKISPLKKKKFEKYPIDLFNFKRNKTTPCASTAVELKYSKHWGRHIVATQDIRPGDIIAIEQNYYTFLCTDGMYLYCSYCTQPTWASIPCQHCIYDVYCSDKCKSEAWIKYHQFECPVYPYIWDIDQDATTFSQCIIRFLFIIVHDAGGIEQLKKDLLDIEECQDPLRKGFSSEGIFESNKPKSLLSLTNKRDACTHLLKFSLTENICVYLYLIATKTNFFGKKIDAASDMLLDDNIIFAGALLLRSFYMVPKNAFKLSHRYGNEDVWYGLCLKAFTSLFNHSCNPNVDMFVSKNNLSILYAKKPITKGSQLFICYNGENFLNAPKKERQTFLENGFHFTCDCQPCLEDWSNICLPSLETLMEFTPGLHYELFHDLDMKNLSKEQSGVDIKYTPKLMEEFANILETLAKKLTTHCEDYRFFESYMRTMLLNYFGSWLFDVSNKCSLYQLEDDRALEYIQDNIY